MWNNAVAGGAVSRVWLPPIAGGYRQRGWRLWESPDGAYPICPGCCTTCTETGRECPGP